MNKLSRIFLGLFLLVLMAIVIVPVEYIHDLYDHNDTKDVVTSEQTSSIDKSHTHCVILKTEFREFSTHPNPQFNFEEFDLGSINYTYQNPLLIIVSASKEQRGPPFYVC